MRMARSRAWRSTREARERYPSTIGSRFLARISERFLTDEIEGSGHSECDPAFWFGIGARLLAAGDSRFTGSWSCADGGTALAGARRGAPWDGVSELAFQGKSHGRHLFQAPCAAESSAFSVWAQLRWTALPFTRRRSSQFNWRPVYSQDSRWRLAGSCSSMTQFERRKRTSRNPESSAALPHQAA